MANLIPKFNGKVEGGKLIVDNKAKLRSYIETLEGKKVVLFVEEYKKVSSTNQKNYYWGVVLKMISDVTGFTKDEAHDFTRSMFAFYHKSDHKFLESTKAMKTSRFEEYMADIRMWASLPEEEGGLNLYIPLPNEVVYDY